MNGMAPSVAAIAPGTAHVMIVTLRKPRDVSLTSETTNRSVVITRKTAKPTLRDARMRLVCSSSVAAGLSTGEPQSLQYESPADSSAPQSVQYSTDVTMDVCIIKVTYLQSSARSNND
jgi:hypothetical protein